VFSVIANALFTHTQNNMKHCLVTGWAKLLLSNCVVQFNSRQIFNIIHDQSQWQPLEPPPRSVRLFLRSSTLPCGWPVTYFLWDLNFWHWILENLIWRSEFLQLENLNLYFFFKLNICSIWIQNKKITVWKYMPKKFSHKKKKSV